MVEKITDNIFKLITAAIIAAVTYLFNTTSTLTHNQDKLTTTVTQIDSEVDDIWGKYNVQIEKEFEMADRFYKYQLRQSEKNADIEKRQLEFEIEYWKNQSK